MKLKKSVFKYQGACCNKLHQIFKRLFEFYSRLQIKIVSKNRFKKSFQILNGETTKRILLFDISRDDMLFYMIDSYMHNLMCNNHAVTNSYNEDWHWCNFHHHHRFHISGMIYDNIDSYKPDSCYIHQWSPKRHSIDCSLHNCRLAGLVLVSVVLAAALACSLAVVLVCLLALVLVLSHTDTDDST